MRIRIYGTGCPRCKETEIKVFNACAQLNLAADISHVFDTEEFRKLGVNGPPAVVVGGKIIISGRVPTVEEIKQLLLKETQ